MTRDQLHAEIDTYCLVWTSLALLHCMVDLGMITELVCQHPECRLPGAPFTKQSPHKGKQGGWIDGLTFDHIIAQRLGGSHHPSNLRIVHGTCNYGWRRGVTGGFIPSGSEPALRAGKKIKELHDAGHYDHIYTPERSAKASVTRRQAS